MIKYTQPKIPILSIYLLFVAISLSHFSYNKQVCIMLHGTLATDLWTAIISRNRSIVIYNDISNVSISRS